MQSRRHTEKTATTTTTATENQKSTTQEQTELTLFIEGAEKLIVDHTTSNAQIRLNATQKISCANIYRHTSYAPAAWHPPARAGFRHKWRQRDQRQRDLGGRAHCRPQLIISSTSKFLIVVRRRQQQQRGRRVG